MTPLPIPTPSAIPPSGAALAISPAIVAAMIAFASGIAVTLLAHQLQERRLRVERRRADHDGLRNLLTAGVGDFAEREARKRIRGMPEYMSPEELASEVNPSARRTAADPLMLVGGFLIAQGFILLLFWWASR